MDQEYQEEFDYYVEVNEELTVNLTDWVYDNIINRTILELEKDMAYDLVDFIQEGRRENAGFLSFIHLDSDNYKRLIRYIRRAFNNSNINIKPTVFKAKQYKVFISEYRDLINVLFSDERFLDNPL